VPWAVGVECLNCGRRNVVEAVREAGSLECRCGMMLTIPSLENARSSPAPQEPDDPEHPDEIPRSDDQCGLKPGQKIGRYSLIRPLGGGGFGEVWLARQEQPARDVALKIFMPRGKSQAKVARGRRRFLREADAAAQLRHPGIVQVYESGEHEGLLFFSMEYVDGIILKKYVKPGPDMRVKVELMRQVADAVGFAHRHGIIHRDLKPKNILITEGRSGPEIRLFDFGLAKILRTDGEVVNEPDSDSEDSTESGSDDAQREDTTGEGVTLGTLHYMAPEHYLRKPDEVDARTDVYAVGVMLYELLTGRRPHNTRHMKRSEALHLIATEQIKPPRKINPRIDPGLNAIIMKALSWDKNRRYPSGAELAADLEVFLSGGIVDAPGAGSAYQISMFVRKRSRGALILGLACMATGICAWLLSGRISAALGLSDGDAERARRAEHSLAEEKALRERAEGELQQIRQELSRNRKPK